MGVAIALPYLVTIAILTLTTGAEVIENNGQTQYLIALPKALQPSVQHTILVQIQSAHVMLQIDSTDPDRKMTDSAVSIFPSGNGVLKYRIPFTNYTSKSIQLTFTAKTCSAIDLKSKCAKAPARLLFERSVRFPVPHDTMMIFIETSKPIYKPGEKVRFRSLPILPSLQLNQTVDGKNKSVVIDLIYLKAPNGVRMAQWTKVDWLQALKGMFFTLSADPQKGKWSIVAKAGSMEETETFLVQEYVLPRFTISANMPSDIFIGDSVVKFSVCAKYSTGRAMKGILKVEFCFKSLNRHRYARRRRRPCIRRTKVLDGSRRCENFNERTAPFQLRKLTYYRSREKAFINATVIEKGTNFTLTKTQYGGSVQVAPFTIDIICSDTFQPELPFYGQIRVLSHEGSARPNEQIKLEVTRSYSDRLYSETLIADTNGIINFVLPPIPRNANSIRITASGINYQSTRPYTSGLIRLTNAYKSKSVQRTYSLSNTHLQIYPLNRQAPQAPCLSGKLIIQLQSTTSLYDKTIRVIGASRGDIQTVQSFGPNIEAKSKCQDQDSELGHYTCVTMKDGTIKIRCRRGWRGTNCMTPICEMGCIKGRCASAGVCLCIKGWDGVACNRCVPRARCANGYCRRGNDCVCFSGYRGRFCSRKVSYPIGTIRAVPRVLPGILPLVIPKPYDPSTQLEDLKLFSRKLEISIDSRLYPLAQIVIWFTSVSPKYGSEIIATTLKMNDLRECLNKSNPTSFSFNQKMARPGQNITATVLTSGYGAKCALAVSDVALDAFGSRGGISDSNLVEEIKQSLKKLQKWKPTDPYYDIMKNFCQLVTPRRPYRSRYWPPTVWSYKRDWSSFFRDAGVFVLSDVKLRRDNCPRQRPVYYAMDLEGAIMEDAVARAEVKRIKRPRFRGMKKMFKKVKATKKMKTKLEKAKAELKVRVRKLFPETWKFELLDGAVRNITVKTPDSVTTWKSTMYCVSSKGIGLSPADRLVVFQSFFVQMSLPYSLVRGEMAILPVKVFSYRKECSEVTLTMKPSAHLTSNGLQVVQSCVCNFDHITFHFRVRPNKLGKIPIEVLAVARPSSRCPNAKGSKKVSVVADAVRRQLFVVPEGIREEISVGDLLCAGGKAVSARFALEAPIKTGFSIVDGSQRAYFTYSGNVFGSSLKNLDSLVRMPYGCGEQNMISMVPSIYVLDYLTKAGISSPQVTEKAFSFITLGYQRELTYRHDDGSFSAFGKRDRSGSTWLTAFVFKSFVAAGQYVTIDSEVLTGALKFLLSKANSRGCFREDGNVIHSSMKGGQANSKDGVAITAYILGALMEANALDKSLSSHTARVISPAVKCIEDATPSNETAMKSISNYGIALRTFALSKWNATHNLTRRYRQELWRRKTKRDGFVFWKVTDMQPKISYLRPWNRYVSADIETTAYAMLSNIATRNVTGNDLVRALPTVRWLTSLKSERGGWFSTQDTIMALQGLSTFAMHTSANEKSTNLSISITTKNGTRTAKVTQENKLVLSKMAIAVPDTMSVKVEGDGCLVAQASVLFNVKETGRLGAPFSLTASATQRPGQCDTSTVRVCAHYIGSSKQSNMAVIKANMASGWQVTKRSLEVLSKNVVEGGLKLIEVDPEKSLVMYFDFFTARSSCVEFSVRRYIEVIGVKPMLIQVYDYYKPHETQEQVVQVVSKVCNESQRTQNDTVKAQCPLCIGVNDTAINLIERLCTKSHLFAAMERQDGGQKWLVTQAMDNFIMKWNAGLELPKGCLCPFSYRVLVGVRTQPGLAMDENVRLDANWVVIDVMSLPAVGHKNLQASTCAGKSDGFAYGYEMFWKKKASEDKKRRDQKKKVTKPSKMKKKSGKNK